MNSGFGTEETKYLRFCAVDCRVGMNVEFFGVIKAVENGIKISEFSERHLMKLSCTEGRRCVNEVDIRRKRKSGKIERFGIGGSMMLVTFV